MMKQLKILALSLALAGVTAKAQALDLVDAWQAAQQHDATWHAAEFAHEAGSAKQWQGFSQLLPQIQATASHSKTRSTPMRLSDYSADQSAETRRKSASLNVSQVIFDWEKFANFSMARQRSLIAQDQLAAARQDLMLRVASAYFDVLLAQNQLSFAQSAKAAFARQLEFAKLSFEVGTMTVVDKYEAQANFDQVTAQELASENRLRLAGEAFTQLTGLAADNFACFDTQAELWTPSEPEQDWLDWAAAHNWSIKMQEKMLAIAKKDAASSRAEHLPTVYLRGNVGIERTHQQSQLGESDSHRRSKTIMAEVSVPIFVGGALLASTREKAAIAEQTRAELLALQRKIRQSTRAAYLGVKSGKALILARSQVVESLQKQLEATALGREVGVRTSLDLLNAERALLDARTNLSQARADYLTAQLQLAALVARLDEARFADLNRQFFRACTAPETKKPRQGKR